MKTHPCWEAMQTPNDLKTKARLIAHPHFEVCAVLVKGASHASAAEQALRTTKIVTPASAECDGYWQLGAPKVDWKLCDKPCSEQVK